jgi:signal transduction histidine kinase
MFSKNAISFGRTTTFRLTLWYLSVFSVLSLTVFGVVYFFLTSHLHDQTDLEIQDSAKEFSALYQEQGLQALRSEFMREAQSQEPDWGFFVLRSAAGNVLTASNPQMKTIPINPVERFQSLELSGNDASVRVGSFILDDGSILQIGITLEGEEILLERYRETFGTALIIMIVCGGLVGWWMARKAMAGVKRVTEAANQIGQHDFDRRVEISNEGEEIRALGYAFNGMLDRTESLFNELQHITDHIAHELRTPITRIRGTAETTLKHGKTLEEFREMVGAVIDGSDDLIGIIGTLLEISKTNSGAAKLEQTSVQLSEILDEAIDLFAPLAEEKQIHIRFDAKSDDSTILGHRSKLQRIVANLLDNAIKYTPINGNISVVLNGFSEAKLHV